MKTIPLKTAAAALASMDQAAYWIGAGEDNGPGGSWFSCGEGRKFNRRRAALRRAIQKAGAPNGL